MKSLIYSILALILLPVVVAVLLGVFTGALTGGIASVASTGVVNGYTLESLQEIEPTDSYPSAELIATAQRAGSNAAFGRDVPPRSDKTFVSSASPQEITEFYEELLTSDGYSRVGIPTPMNPQNTETRVAVWKRGNVYFRISFDSDARTLIESGGEPGDALYKVYITPLKS